MYVCSVSQLNSYLKALLESDEALRSIWVQGEVSNRGLSPAGHLYFTLKDGQSQIRCVSFRGQLARLGMPPPENGHAVLAHGRVSIYEVQGAYQLYVDLIQPEGVGLLHLRFEELRARLEAEGLFDPARKRPLPAFPRKIGVVTSPTGAAIRDIISVLRRRYPLAEMMLAPATVQGDEAAPTICLAIEALNEWTDVDVIVVARGGGSIEELWPFNEERVARAIYASRAPVVSGVGHDTDYTIADMVADLRAPTPSAAAELISPNCRDYQTQVSRWQEELGSLIGEALEERRESLRRVGGSLLHASPSREMSQSRQRVDDMAGVATAAVQTWLALRRERVHNQEMRLAALNPLAVLQRGYSICRHGSTGQVITRIADVAPGDSLQIRVSDGAFAVTAD